MKLDMNAPGALERLLAMHRQTFGDLRMEDGDDDGSGGQDGSDSGGSSGAQSDKGFPDSTPLTEMTDAQQAAYWKFQSRKHEATAKARGDYDEVKARAAEADRLRQERETESEKAVREARETAAAEERAKAAPRLVSAEFRAAAKGVLSDEQRDALLKDLDLTRYLNDKGEVDTAKVEKKVAAFAPKQDERRRLPKLPQGDRERVDQKPSVATGREMFQARRGTKAS